MAGLSEIYSALQSLTASLNNATSLVPRPGGNVTPINNLSSAGFITIISSDPKRNSITFVNPGPSTVMVAPKTQGSANQALAPTATALGGSFPVLPSAFVTLAGTVQQGYQAMATAGSSQPFTVMTQ